MEEDLMSQTVKIRETTFISNGDNSGMVRISRPVSQGAELSAVIEVPGGDLVAFVAEHVRNLRIAELEQMTALAPLGREVLAMRKLSKMAAVADRHVASQREKKIVYVVMGNDYPAAVFEREADAIGYCDEKAKLPESRHPSGAKCIYWRSYSFEVRR
jgi:hypothetical protein